MEALCDAHKPEIIKWTGGWQLMFLSYSNKIISLDAMLHIKVYASMFGHRRLYKNIYL